MRFGACVDYKWLPQLQKAGYDYLEYNLSRIATMSEEEFTELQKTIATSPLKIESYNGFFPAGTRLTGPDADYEQIREYTEKAMVRASKLGGKVTVLGSGSARKIPEGFDFDTAYGQFAAILELCGSIAAKYGITIALEPLRCAETNLINTVEQGLELCRKVNHPHVKCLADFFHVYSNGESLEAIRSSENWLAHIHLARANPDRHVPYPEDLETCRQWADALRECGYHSRISLEGAFEPTIPEALSRAREILKVFEA